VPKNEPRVMPAPLALLLQRCPRCRQGALFRGIVEMSPRCPVCGLDLEPEVGYYTGAMVVSYTLSIPLLGVVALVVGFVTRWELQWVILTASVVYLAFVVPLFRYARTIWLYLDWALNPGSFR
jgi:uncharacterized protein (DUF983 family)